jgi:hypothetical protein
MVPLCCPPCPWLLQKEKNINELDNRNKKLTQTNILAKLYSTAQESYDIIDRSRTSLQSYKEIISSDE